MLWEPALKPGGLRHLFRGLPRHCFGFMCVETPRQTLNPREHITPQGLETSQHTWVELNEAAVKSKSFYLHIKIMNIIHELADESDRTSWFGHKFKETSGDLYIFFFTQTVNLFDCRLILCHWALQRLTYFRWNCWSISCFHLLMCTLAFFSTLLFSSLLYFFFPPAEHQQFLLTYPLQPSSTDSSPRPPILAFIIWTGMHRQSARAACCFEMWSWKKWNAPNELTILKQFPCSPEGQL